MAEKTEVEVVLADLHVGHPQSGWKAAVECLARLDEQYQVFAIYFAGDTLEMAYAHQFGGPSALQGEYTRFFRGLETEGLAGRCIFLQGNHDSNFEVLPSAHEFLVLECAWLFCQNFHVLILHGHGIGYERVASSFGHSARALIQLRARLEKEQPGRLPCLSRADWLVTGHFDIPVRNLSERVVGLGSWVGDLNRDDRAYYGLIDPAAMNAAISLHKYDGQLHRVQRAEAAEPVLLDLQRK
jgi:hypothetical protein